jgi:hypothetical protein
MKAVAARPDDLADIRRALRANPDLDRTRVRRWTKEFADALDAPDLLTQLDAILKANPRPRRRRR